MKIIKISYERLKYIAEAVEFSKMLPIEYRTYKINNNDEFLSVYFKKDVKK